MKKNIKKIIICLLFIGLLVYCFTDGNYNSKYKLNIISSYGDDESYHPKVLVFDKEWNGYKYWMSYTPYPQGDDSKENPHIAVSNDLVTWEPIYKQDRALNTPKEAIPGQKYNSDSHIVYNNDTNELEMYWRYVDNEQKDVYLYRMVSKDGTTWSDKEISAYSEVRLNHDYISPAILYENGTYKMWYVDADNKVKYTESKDAKNWSEGVLVDLKYEDKLDSWHLDVIKSDLGYEMLMVAFDDWDHHNDMSLYYSKSSDGISWDKMSLVLEPTVNTGYWDNKGIYRCSFVKINGVYIVYYGGTNTDYHHGMGLVWGKDIHKLNKTNVNFSNKEARDKFAKLLQKEIK